MIEWWKIFNDALLFESNPAIYLLLIDSSDKFLKHNDQNSKSMFAVNSFIYQANSARKQQSDL